MADRRHALAVGALVAAALLVILAGPGLVATSIAAADWPLVAGAAVAGVAFFVLRGWRWSMLARPYAHVPARDCVGASATAWAVSSVVPFKAGDVARVAWMARRTGTAPSLATVAVERTLDLLALAVVAGGALVAFAVWGPGIMAPMPSWAVVVAVALAIPLLAVVGLALAVRRASRQAAPTSQGTQPSGASAALAQGAGGPTRVALAQRAARVRVAVQGALQGLAVLARDRRGLARLGGLSLLVTGAQVSLHALLAAALLPGADAWALAAAAPLFLITFAVAVLPGHVGTYEAGFVAAYSLTGAPVEGLMAAAVAAHVIGTSIVLLLGLAGLGMLAARGALRRTTAASPLREPAPALSDAALDSHRDSHRDSRRDGPPDAAAEVAA